jgi:hypothetical protein
LLTGRQATGRAAMRIIFVHVLWVFAVIVSPVQAADDPGMHHLPGAIETTTDLRQHMEMMLQRSATFRQQCRQLDAPRVRVEIHRDVRLSDKAYRALTVIRRSDDRIVASVEITGFGDPTEWLAHEIEHVLEQIDGVDIRRLVRTRHDAWPSTAGAFETMRAIRAGQTVRQEVRDSRRVLARSARTPDAARVGDD